MHRKIRIVNPEMKNTYIFLYKELRVSFAAHSVHLTNIMTAKRTFTRQTFSLVTNGINILYSMNMHNRFPLIMLVIS